MRVVKIFSPFEEELGADNESTLEDYFYADPLNRFYKINKEISPWASVDKIEGLYIFEPKVKIKEIYLGLRNPLLEPGFIQEKEDTSISDILVKNKITPYKMKMTTGTWSIESEKCDPKSIVEKINDDYRSVEITGKDLNFILSKLNHNQIEATDNFELYEFLDRFSLKKNGQWLP